MDKLYIAISQENLIDPTKLVDLIVDRICPRHELSIGIDCVLNKMLFSDLANTHFPVKFEQEDREIFEKLLPLLPGLHGNMAESEIQVFMDSYRALDGRQKWEPYVVDQKARTQREESRDFLRREHSTALRNAVTARQVKAVNGDFLPVKHLSFGTLIPKEEALMYVKGLGLFHASEYTQNDTVISHKSSPPLQGAISTELAIEKLERNDNGFSEQTDAPHFLSSTEQLAPSNGLTSDAPLINTPVKKKSHGLPTVWTEEFKAEVAAYRKKHGTKRAAEHFLIDESLIRRKLPTKPKKQIPQKNQLDSVWISKR